jgi:hypothetical protein
MYKFYFVNWFYHIYSKNFEKSDKKMSHNVLRYTTFQPAHKAMRSIAADWNVGEGGVGT